MPPPIFCLFQLECAGVELIVGAPFGDELFVASALDDAAVVEDHDNVGVLDGGQTVRDDEHRAALHQLIHAALHDGLGARVDGAGRLVEDHHRRVGDRRAGDGDELALALREVRAVVGQQRVVALAAGV